MRKSGGSLTGQLSRTHRNEAGCRGRQRNDEILKQQICHSFLPDYESVEGLPLLNMRRTTSKIHHYTGCNTHLTNSSSAYKAMLCHVTTGAVAT